MIIIHSICIKDIEINSIESHIRQESEERALNIHEFIEIFLPTYTRDDVNYVRLCENEGMVYIGMFMVGMCGKFSNSDERKELKKLCEKAVQPISSLSYIGAVKIVMTNDYSGYFNYIDSHEPIALT